MSRLLITGASGFLGWTLCQHAKSRWEVFGTVFTHEIEISGVKTLSVDLTSFQQLKKLFQTVQPQGVIHTAAITAPNYCQTHQEESYRANVEASINIAKLCAEHQIPYVYTSTDLVFDGLDAPYVETDPVHPVNLYGEHKALAEEGILQIYPSTAVCRLPLMFGVPAPFSGGFMQPLLQSLRSGNEFKLFTDEFRTPVSTKTAISGLLLALEKVTGIIHLGGVEAISRYDFACLLAQVFKIKEANLKPCLQADVIMSAPRPPNVSMDSHKAFQLGFKPLLLKEELEQLSLFAKNES